MIASGLATITAVSVVGDGGYRRVRGGVVADGDGQSPTFRTRKSTNAAVREQHGFVMGRLQLGPRTVTHDVLIAASFRVSRGHPDELVAEVEKILKEREAENA